ncbi:hypothetical protein JTB14_021697 [Gonioctena quinquepunctata]|nr:hypothetical protein JTB14_021697 [Gonioctena quinquepunctata]
MGWLIILVASLVAVHCRPQSTENTQDPGSKVEVEKQNIIEVRPEKDDQKKIANNTDEILEKIAEVNKKQGLETRKHTPNYFHFPTSFSRSQAETKSKGTPRADFQFTTNTFKNPIFEYLEREKHERQDTREYLTRHDLNNNRQPQDYHPHLQGYEFSSTNHNAEITEEDMIPGQYVKRKIVHQQTFIVPNQNMVAGANSIVPPYDQPSFVPFAMPPSSYEVGGQENDTDNQGAIVNLGKQTVDNIKNIVSNSQFSHNPVYQPYHNPYSQHFAANNPNQFQYGFMTPNRDSIGQLPHSENLFNQIPTSPLGKFSSNGQNYHVYGPFSPENVERGRQNWNWPGANYFPIVIRDPFIQMYNAITSMVEYGPNAGQQNPCRNAKKDMDTLLREGKTAKEDGTKISVEVDGNSPSPQITITGLDSENKNNSYLDFENIDIGSGGDNSLKFTMSVKKEERAAKDTEEARSVWDRIKVTGKSSALVLNATRMSSKFSESTKDLRPITILKNQVASKPAQNIISPPLRDPTHQTEEFGDETEEEKSEEIISNDHNKKLFSRDNTGSGVFIHKLKVRKGGVAIAGPGGIATAGSGGTAIVGPNGIAYTHPDSLAIAGSGTKVIDVDPAINLGDLVNNATNNSRLDGFPPSRVGKVVAVGPVVYYNRG